MHLHQDLPASSGQSLRRHDLLNFIATDEIMSLDASDGHWLTRAGMHAVLRGRCPSENEVLESRALWREESRIGLERQQHTRTAKESMLYSSTHVRLMHGRPRPRRPGHRGDVALGVRVSGGAFPISRNSV